jgi:hypothetical protein
MTFARSTRASGSFLLGYLDGDGVTMEALRAAFGPADPDAYWDDEKGYVGDDMTFACGERFVRVYSRFGSPRIGGLSEADAAEFVVWLRANGFPRATLRDFDLAAYEATMRAHAAINEAMMEDPR